VDIGLILMRYLLQSLVTACTSAVDAGIATAHGLGM
jgi:hypothetical protein